MAYENEKTIDMKGMTLMCKDVRTNDGATSLSTTELGALDGAVAGTPAAGKVVIPDTNVNIGAAKVTQLHIGASGSETQVTATAAELNYNDIASLGTGAPSKSVVLDANGDYLWPSTGQLKFGAATNALVHGGGSSSAALSLGSTAGNALEYYLSAAHTSGDMRGMYLKLTFAGAGGAGEALRAFGSANVATSGTVNGAHITMSASGSGANFSAGAANALRATFGLGASANPNGTCSVMQVDTDFDNTATVPSNFAFLRFTNSNTKKSSNLMRIPNVAAETGGLFCAHVTQTMTHSIKIVSEDGTAYYVMCTNANTNRTEA